MTSFEVPCRHCAKSRLEHLKPMTYNTCSKFEYMHISSGPIIDVTPDGVEVIQERDDSGVLTLDKLREAIEPEPPLWDCQVHQPSRQILGRLTTTSSGSLASHPGSFSQPIKKFIHMSLG